MPPIKHPLSPGGSTLAVLDANVLLPPRLSDLLFDLALTGLYHPRWTQAIEDEFIRHFGAVALAQNKKHRKAIQAASPDPAHSAKAKHRLHCGQEYEVLLYDQPGYKNRGPSKVHAGDMHVASAALVLHTLAQEECAVDKVFIVSSNLPHLAVKEMALIGIDVVSPGDFINRLNAAAPAQVEHALLKTIHDLTSPPCHKEDLLKLLITHGAEETAKYHAAKWNA
ncbi:hypothetical protein [Janthinobacterium sp.]|uniref:hypothetical protein n=1 Tax=Janthinobacterium sp. TaxID=1871054 RepID=UPI0026318142|nr:hypothetical protein [Janthinobacterium sp.]